MTRLRPPSSRAIALARRYRPMKIYLARSFWFRYELPCDRGAGDPALHRSWYRSCSNVSHHHDGFPPWGRAVVCRINSDGWRRKLFVDALWHRAAECRSCESGKVHRLSPTGKTATNAKRANPCSSCAGIVHLAGGRILHRASCESRYRLWDRPNHPSFWNGQRLPRSR
jgi:hypothetical protein